MALTIATHTVPGELPRKFTAIAEAGFRSIELHEPDFTGFDGSARQFADLVRDHELEIDLLSPFSGFEGLQGSEHSLGLERLEHKLDLMQALGTRKLLFDSCTDPQALTDHSAIADDLSLVAERAAARNIRVAYRALPWATAVTSESAAFGLADHIDNPFFGVGLNSIFTLADGTRPAQIRHLSGDRIFHVQLTDAPALISDLRQLNGQSGMLPGQGVLNLGGFVRAVVRCGYEGNWSVSGVNDIPALDSSRQIASDAYRSLLNLLDEVARTEPVLRAKLPVLPGRIYASGFEFVEFAVDDSDSEVLNGMLSSLSFRRERRHLSKAVELWRQGAVNIVVNREQDGFAHECYQQHGPTVCDMGLRVTDAGKTVSRAATLGVPEFSQPVGSGELEIPAVRDIGGNIVHFIDEKSNLHRMWDIDFNPVKSTTPSQPAGLRRIDHIAQSMRYDQMQSWLLYYISTFEMDKSPVVDVSDPSGVTHSQAIASPEGEVRMILNGTASGRTVAGAFVSERVGAAVQHIAFQSDDIFETSRLLQASGFPRLSISPNYYDDLQTRFGLSGKFLQSLKTGDILYDRDEHGEFFQIYSIPIFNGFFFEIVERRAGYTGYGARNASVRLAAQLHHTAEQERSQT